MKNSAYKKFVLVIILLVYYCFIWKKLVFNIDYNLRLWLPISGIFKNSKEINDVFNKTFFMIFFYINLIGIILIIVLNKKKKVICVPIISTPFLIKSYFDNLNLFNPNKLFAIKFLDPVENATYSEFSALWFHDGWVYNLQTTTFAILILLIFIYGIAFFFSVKIITKDKNKTT